MNETSRTGGISVIDSSLRDFLLHLWVRKGVIFMVTIICGVLGFVASMLMQPMYQADALLQIESHSNGLSLTDDVSELLSTESDAVTEIEILRSRLVVGQVVDELSLDISARPYQLPIVGNFLSRRGWPKPDWLWLQHWAWAGESITIESLSLPDSWLGTDIYVVRSDELSFSVTLPHGENVSGVFGKAISLAEYNFSISITSLNAPVGVKFIVRKGRHRDVIQDVRKRLGIAEKARKTGILQILYIDENPLVAQKIAQSLVKAYVDQNIGRSAAEAERSLLFLREQIPLLQSQINEAETQLNTYRSENQSVDLNLETQSSLERIVSLDTQLSLLALEETELSRRFTKRHPRYQALLQKQQQLTQERDTQSESIRTLPQTQQSMLTLMRDLEVNQQIFIELLQKTQELDVLKAGAVGNARLIDEASVLSKPVKPRRFLITIISALWGGLLIGLFVLIKNSLGRPIESSNDLEKLGSPIYAVVPKSKVQTRLDRNSETKSSILAHEKPDDLAVEAIRSLRTSLYFGMSDDHQKIVSVTGPSPAVGKSFICTNLAYLAANAGQRVLLIDADLRRGTLAKHVKLPKHRAGLSDLLAGQASLDDVRYLVDLKEGQVLDTAFASASEQMSDSTLNNSSTVDSDQSKVDIDLRNLRSSFTIIPRGKAPPNPSELLMSPRFGELFESVAPEYDLIIVDTPPALAATDSLIVGRYANMNLMIVRQDETKLHEAEEVLQMFHNNRSRVHGVVLNGFVARASHYGTAYGYRYNYS